MSVGSKRNLSSLKFGSLPGTGRAIADAVFLMNCKASSTLDRDAALCDILLCDQFCIAGLFVL